MLSSQGSEDSSSQQVGSLAALLQQLQQSSPQG